MENLVTRPLGWIVRWLGVQTLLVLALLLVVLGSVAWGLADLVRGLDAGLLLPVAVSGVMMGWVLAKSRLPGWLGGLSAFVLGAGAASVHVGRLGGPLMALLRALADLAWEALPPGGGLLDGPPDRSPVTLALAELGTGMSTLLIHVRDWLLALVRGQATFDPVVAALVWSLGLWAAAVWAGWAVRRRDQALQGITPAGVLLATGLSYAEGNPFSLVPLLGATLLLMVLTGHIARERRWQAAGTDFSLEIRLDLALAGVSLSLLLLAMAMLASSVSVRPIFKLARQLMVEHLGEGKQVADSLGLEPGAAPTTTFDQARAAGLPRRHLLGSGPELSRRVVMVVYLEEPKHTGEGRLAAAADQPRPRYYWRSLTYDRYTGRGWHTGATETVEYKAGELAVSAQLSPGTPSHWTIRQKVQAVGSGSTPRQRPEPLEKEFTEALGGLLYVAGELVMADHDYSVAWRAPGDAFGAQIEATVYRADSLLPLVSEAQLRSAGSDYPDWVRDRYLALPDEVPARVLALAHDLTATEPTPYDRARAIETYLRTFPYTLDLPVPPSGRDVADYFLFDLRQGYCDYYATAMVVLARAAGLPARLVIGYASGTYNAANNRYVVTEADAHSWVQVYFPGYGWVEFEPTGGRPPIERPAETTPFEIPEPMAALEPATGGRSGPGRLLSLVSLGGLLSLGLGGVAWWVTDGWRLRRQPPAAAMTTLYQRLYRHGRRLAVPVEAGNTPYEFAARLAGRVAELAQDKRWSATLASTAQEVRWLTDLYVRGLYSPHRPNAAEQAQAIQRWRRLRRRLWLAWLWQKASSREERPKA